MITRSGFVVVLIAFAGFGGPPALHAQTEVQVAGVWVNDYVRGPYVGVLHDWLVGPVKVDTTWVELGGGRRQPVTARVGRRL